MTRMEHFNPRSSCEERLFEYLRAIAHHVCISIHAPHARSDLPVSVRKYLVLNFNPRSSCEERHDPLGPSKGMAHFNPRSSCEERRSIIACENLECNFNPRSSCEERHGQCDGGRHDHRRFQSTLLMRGATRQDKLDTEQILFQSTLLMRGATVSLSSIDLLDFIIHFSRTQHLFPKTLLLALCPISPIFCVMALRA